MDQERIFDRFVRTDFALDSAIKGAGLGLYISRWLVELHGGRLWVVSVPGQGATFLLTLPLAPSTQ